MRQSVVDHLLSKPGDFSLFQAIYVLESLSSHRGSIGTFAKPSQEGIKLGNVPSLGFPASQIEYVESIARDEHNIYRIATSILGLYGINSPLPLHYTAMLVSFQDDDTITRDRVRGFLDLFNHRILSLAYRVDSYRLIAQNPGNCVFENDILKLLGMSEPGESIESVHRLGMIARHRHLVSQSRSSGSLRIWLQYLFPGILLNIEEFSSQWVRIPEEQLASIGRVNCSLGGGTAGATSSAIIGDSICERETNFRLAVGPMKWDVFLRFLPSKPDLEDLVEAVRQFVPDWLSFDVSLKLLGSDCRYLQVCLDGETSKLGFTAGLFNDSGAQDDLMLVLDVHLTGGAELN
jgi:type VI secretion system protein ImpH